MPDVVDLSRFASTDRVQFGQADPMIGHDAVRCLGVDAALVHGPVDVRPGRR